MADESVASVIKRGETVIQTTLHRGVSGNGEDKARFGLTVSVKTHRNVEEFAKAMGTGEASDIVLIGRYWQPVGTQPLMVYDSSFIAPEALKTDEGRAFRFDRVGQPLIADDGTVNISFLRLVGVSEGAGVTFRVAGIFSVDSLRFTRDMISSACKKFYIHYMRPVDLTVQISTQEIQY